MGIPILKLTDGTTSINLITSSGQHGIHLSDWAPVASAYKNDGIWSDSPLADGRRIVDRRWGNAIETYEIVVDSHDQNSLIETMQDARRLLEKAAEYWISDWQNEPVWIEAKAACETNTRYSLVAAGRIPQDDNPYNQPFFNNDSPVFDDLAIIIEREPFWRNLQPETSECIPISAVENYCYPAYLEFDADGDLVNCGSNATLDDLPDNAVAGKGQVTVDAWIRADSYGETNGGRIISKGDFIRLSVNSVEGLRGLIDCATTDAFSTSGTDEFSADGEWHHVLMTYDETGGATPAARTIYLAIDGVWVASYRSQIVSVGNYTSDAAQDLIIGNRSAVDRCFDGGIGWVRVSNNIRYAVGIDFDPPDQCVLPIDDVNTMMIVIHEGSGSTTYDTSGNSNDGAITNALWDCVCDNLYGNVLGRCGPAYVDGDGTNTVINCGSAAKLDDIPSGDQITFEAWIKPHGYFGANPVTQLTEKGSASLRGWNCAIVSTTGQIYGRVNCATSDAYSATFSDVVPIDDEWHHVVMTYSDTGDRKVYIAGDGVWAPSYVTQNTGNGAYVSDASDNLLLMNDNTGNTCFWGGMMIVRISDSTRYTPGVNFTPPSRCSLLTNDANTIWMGIREGQGTTIYDLSATPSNGTLSDGFWECDCYPVSEYSGEVLTGEVREPTCEDDVYVASKHNEAVITNVHWWDASANAWSPNLQHDALPVPLLPAVPGAGDVIIFGSDTLVADSGPFCSLVFDILTVQNDLQITWRYSSGGNPDPTTWNALGCVDCTNADGLATGQPFDTAGVKSVASGQSTFFLTHNPTIGGVALGVTGYWWAAHVTAIGAAPSAPVQQNRRIYTVISPYVEIQSADVLGDVQALVEILARSQSSQFFGMELKRMVCGLRSTSRGLDFSPYFNCADEQNRDGVSYTDTLLTADVAKDTGWKDVAAAPGSFWNDLGYWTIDEDYAEQYWGKYHAYLCGFQTTGVSGDIRMRLRVVQGDNLATGREIHISDEKTWSNPGPAVYEQEVIDFGLVELPGGSLMSDEVFPIMLVVDVYGNAASNVEIYKLVIMPIDEWAGALELDGILPWRTETFKGGVFIADGTYPKMTKRGLAVEYTTNQALETAPLLAAQPPFVQANARQRLWFWFDYNDQTWPYGLLTVRMNDVDRYWTMRGSR